MAEPEGSTELEAAAQAQRDQDDAAKRDRHERIREEAEDAGTYRKALEEQGFSNLEALDMVKHWQGWRWDTEDGAP